MTPWRKEVTLKEYGAFSGSASTEIAIVGAGMAGSLAAYFLSKAGKKVIVLDKNKGLKDSATVHTTAFLSTDVDTALADLKSMFGGERGNNVWRAHADAIDTIEKIVEEEKIDCEFMRVPEYWYATSEDGFKGHKEEAAEGKSAGFTIEEVPREEMKFKNSGVLEFKNQGKFHPLKFLKGIREKAESYGVTFYENSEVEDIEGEEKMTVLLKNGGTITADYAIVATYLSIENPPTIFGKKGMYLSYVYNLSIPKGSLKEALYLDDMNPYHYFRIDSGKGENGDDRMVFGGEDHRRELPVDDDKQFRGLEKHLEEYFPDLKYTVVDSWRGPILETLDGLAYIGVPSEKRPHLLVATGFSGNGMTYSTISAMILTDIVLGKKNKYEEVFSPQREVTVKGILYKTRDYLGEFAGGYLKNIFNKEAEES